MILCCVDVSCRLSDDQVGSMLDKGTRTWHVTDTVLKKHDLQNIINCTSKGDTVALQTMQRIQPHNRIDILWDLTIDGAWSKSNEKAHMTCPSDSEGLFLIK